MRTPQSLRFFLIMLGCALPISPAYSQVTFLPPGAQLDGDAILDIVPGAQIKFSTFYGGGPIRLISYEAQWDTTELQLIFPTVVSATNPFPEHFQLPVGQLTFVHQNPRDQFGVPLRPNRPGPFGLDELTFRVLRLNNDGQFDFRTTNGIVYTFEFDTLGTGGPYQDVEVQPIPEPSAWVMMIAGFGAIGMAMRRSRRRTAQLTAA